MKAQPLYHAFMRRCLPVLAISVLTVLLSSCTTTPAPVIPAAPEPVAMPAEATEPPEATEAPVLEQPSPTSVVIEVPVPGPEPIPPVLEVPPNPPQPEPQPEPQSVVTEPLSQPEMSPEPPLFDPSTVSVEKKQATLVDTRALIEKLNMIIQAKDYDAWVTFLTEDFRNYYSSAPILAKFSESALLRHEGTVLRSLKDYFISVVFRSRQSARLDDIEFIGEDKILALMINSRGERIVLYYLEKQNDSWKIGIGR